MTDVGIAHLDVEGSLKRMGDDRELLRDLYDAFLADAPFKLGMLREAVGRDGMEQVVKHAHSLKGAAAAIGAERCRALAESLEHVGRGSRPGVAAELLAQVEAEVAYLVQALSRQAE